MTFKPPFLRREDIAEKAEEFRATYVRPVNQIPLDIENIIESVLRIRIDPRENLSTICWKNQLAIDSYLTFDRKTIVVDAAQFMQNQGRLKFTLAHEIGHWFLHEKAYQAIRYASLDDFIEIQKKISEKDRNRFEIQANEFAGVLLVPHEQLFNQVEPYVPEIERFIEKRGKGQIWEMKDSIAQDLAPKFDVSAEVVKYRIDNDNIIESLV